MKPKKDLEAVHKQDLRMLLENWGLLVDFDDQKMKCHFCGDVILERNFGAIYSENKQILFSCSKLNCLSKLNPKK